MVDSRYLGRADKTKRYLTDHEVVRHHSQRRLDEQDAAALLDAEFARDPIPSDRRLRAHLFLVAEPVAGRAGMLLALTHGEHWQQRVHGCLQSRLRDEAVTGALAAARVGGFSPSLEELSRFDRREGGVALTSSGLGPGRVLTDDGWDPESLAELEIREDGGLRVFLGRLSDHRDAQPTVQMLFDSAVVLYVRQFLSLVAGAAEQAGYLSHWAVAAGATGLRGCRSYSLHQGAWSAGRKPPYSGEVYRRGVIASRSDLVSGPGQLSDRLVGPLLRGLGVWQRYEAALTDQRSTFPPRVTSDN